MKVKLITEKQVGGGGLLNALDEDFEKPLNDFIKKIETAGGTIKNIKYNLNELSGRIRSIAVEYED